MPYSFKYSASLVMLALLLPVVFVQAAYEDSETTYVVTSGTNQRSLPAAQGGNTDLSAHGFRFSCVPSHYSYDDPVVYPGQEGAAHLHMFFGNTNVNYQSTSDSILNTGSVTCAGGVTNRSAYWVPALYNEDNEVVLPYTIINYYKSWVQDRSKIQPIPAGLQILANDKVSGSGGVSVAQSGTQASWAGSIRVTDHDGLSIEVQFPDCVAIDSAGNPILTSPGGTSHVAYSNGGACPASHPYTIPQLIQNIRWNNVPFASNWQLASDASSATKGQSAHADYIAGWTEQSAQIMADCVRDGYRECGPDASSHEYEMSLSPEGEQLYQYFLLRSDVDATPFGFWPKTSSETTSQPVHETLPVQTTSDSQPSTKTPAGSEKTTSPKTKSEKVDTEVKKESVSETKKVIQEKRVITTENLNVRSEPNGSKITMVPKGSAGSIVSATRVALGEYQWIKVTFDSGVTGYVVELYTTSMDSSLELKDTQATQERIKYLLTVIELLQKLLKELRLQN